jgi:predicted heme/steroid binding protein
MDKTEDTAILFQFADNSSAEDASATLRDLGYDPVVHEGGKLHIHMEGSDLTSALEIAMSHGGELMDKQPLDPLAVTGLAYGMDSVPIPAHTVNEDWTDTYAAGTGDDIVDEDAGLNNRDEDGEELMSFHPDDGSYNFMSGDVHT